MSSDWDDDHERITSRHNRQVTDTDHTLGQLMVESLNHRRRIEVIETRLEVLEARVRILASKTKDSLSPPSSTPPIGRGSQLFVLAKKTTIITVTIIVAAISAAKELGLLK